MITVNEIIWLCAPAGLIAVLANLVDIPRLLLPRLGIGLILVGLFGAAYAQCVESRSQWPLALLVSGVLLYFSSQWWVDHSRRRR